MTASDEKATAAAADSGPPPIVLAEAQAAAAAANEDSESDRRPSTAHHHGEHHDRQSSLGVSDAFPSFEDLPPPPYNGSEYGHLDISQNGFETGARVADDGRVNININQRSRKLSNLLLPALRNQLHLQEKAAAEPVYIPPGLAGVKDLPPPPMNVVIQIVGSRGDVQPFIALGQVLKDKYGHRVRIATHPNFKDFVNENGLEFFSIGGDPSELMAFMVKNPGLMPGFDSLKNGDVGKRRKGIYEMIVGCWRSCIESGDGTGPRASDSSSSGSGRESFDSGIGIGGDPMQKPFVADAIIANPPSFAHMHIAEKLGIPLHLMFTMPWSPTQAFPHPLANIQSSNADSSMANFISYALIDMMTWQGLGDVINGFREKHLGLEPVSIMWAPGMASRLRIPYTYCWSPALIPKPRDWGSYIDISGFFFLNLSSNYTPPEDLAAFLEAGPPPVYIGFGSIVVDDPNAMTKMIFDAVKKTGQRTLVSKGWGGFGADEFGIPDGVFMLGNCPHDWLFKRVSCVVHHGGAGTTAAGIAAGRPTVVVPFFGDQPFWGAMTAKAGAGPPPHPYKDLTSDKLAAAIKEALKPESLERAAELSAKISKEHGQESGAESFHKQLKLDELRCSLYPQHIAVWRVKRTDIRLSALAATVLGNEGLLDFGDLKLYRGREYETEDGPWDPISGGAAALMGTIGNLTMGVADFPVEILKSLRTASGADHPKDKDSSLSSTSPRSNSARTSTTDLSRNTTNQSQPAPASDLASQESTATTVTDNGINGKDSHSNMHPDPTKAKTPDATPTPSRKPSAMSTVFSNDSVGRRSSRHGSRSSSPSGHKSPTHDRHCPGEVAGQVTLEGVIGGGKAVGKIVSAGMKSPMDFTMGLAKGFHNAPKLYGDDTVRKSEKITDLQSGFKAAGKEFGYGFYDGITGLVTQPMAGAKKEGFAGFVKGAAKGMGGFILKPGAGIWGIPGYTFKGIYAEVQKHFGSSVQNYIIAARTAQGYEEWKASSAEQRTEIVTNWQSAQVEIRKGGRKFGKEKEEEIINMSQTKSNPATFLTGFQQTRHLSFDDRKKLAAEKKKWKEEQKKKQAKERKESGGEIKSRCKYCPFHHEDGLHHSATAPPVPARGSTDVDDFEEAISRSVTATSRGNPDEDALVERALRASLAELQHANTTGADDAYELAVRAGASEHSRATAEAAKHDDKVAGELETGTTTAEHDAEVAEALRQSLAEYKRRQEALASTHGHHHGHNDPEGLQDWSSDSGLGTEDDEDFKRTLEESKRQHTEETQSSISLVDKETASPSDDADLHKAITESENAHKAQADELERQKTEEEIVLEYVKKQSLLEEQHRQKVQQGKASDNTEATS